VIYFYQAEPGRIFMAMIYSKSRKETLSSADQIALARLAGLIRKASKKGQ